MAAAGALTDKWAAFLAQDHEIPVQLRMTPDLQRIAREAAERGDVATLRNIFHYSGRDCFPRDKDYSYEIYVPHDCKCGGHGFCHARANIYFEAGAAGQVAVLDWLFDNDDPVCWDFAQIVLIQAAERGNMEMLSLLYDKATMLAEDRQPSWGSLGAAEACRRAAGAGHQAVLEWLHSHVPDLPGAVWQEAAQKVAAYGHFQALVWMYENVKGICWRNGLCSLALRARHFAVVRWLCTYGPGSCLVDHDLLEAAVTAGHSSMLQWLRTLAPQIPLGESLLVAALKHGHVDVLAYLREQRCPWGKDAIAAAAQGMGNGPWDGAECRTMKELSRRSCLKAVQVARSLDPPCPWTSEALKTAIREHDHELVSWLLQHKAPRPPFSEYQGALVQLDCHGTAMLTVLDVHGMRIPLSLRVHVTAARKHYCCVVGCTRWARRTGVHAACDLDAPSSHGALFAHGTASKPHALLFQLARLPDELIFKIASSSMGGCQGGRARYENQVALDCALSAD